MRAIGIKSPTFEWKVLLKTGFVSFFGILATLITLNIIAEIVLRVHGPAKSDLHNKMPSRSYSSLEEFFICFNLRENYRRALKLESLTDYIPVISGFRTIVCLWITLFHVYYFGGFAQSNIPLLYGKLESISLQPVLQAIFYVDVFFLISSFLLCYNFLSDTNSMNTIKTNSVSQNIMLFLKLVLRRYVRLLPVLVISMILSDCMQDFLDMFSLFRMNRHTGIYCKETWWYSILFISNSLNLVDICNLWSWYLSCELQYFILFTLLLFIYTKNQTYGKIVFLVFLSISLIVSCWSYTSHGITFSIDSITESFSTLYAKPWTRIVPYFAGTLMGWYFHRCEGKPIKMSRMGRTTFWIVALVVYVYTNIMSYWRSTPTWTVAIIMTFGKMAFGVIFCFTVMLCHWGQGGPLQSIMSSRPFLFLNKFCYSLYMVAPIVIVLINALHNKATHFSEVGSAADFLGIIVISLAVAFLVVLLVEIPIQRVSSRFLFKRKAK